MRSCLEREPAETVKGIEYDIKEMWKRLDEKYGDPAKLTDTIVNTIQNIRPIKEEENKRFIQLVVWCLGSNDFNRFNLRTTTF